MTKIIQSKSKISRRLGVNLWGRDKDAFNYRNYGPGQHGQRRKKPSDYGTQLIAKQKLKFYYGAISEKQFRRTYNEAVRLKGDTSENLVGLLECRLDAFVYRMAFLPTIFAARQFVGHGHVLVNGKKVNVPSYHVKVGDVVEVKEKSKQMPVVLETLAKPERSAPEYLEYDEKKLSAKLLRVPTLQEIPYPVMMEPSLVVEYYSR